MSRWMVALVALVGWGCADTGALTAEGGGILEAESTESELMYLVDNAAVRAAFADGTHELIPNQSFQAVDFVYVNEGEPTLEYQVLIGGEWTEWMPIVPGDIETAHRASVIRVSRAAQGLKLRGGDALDFARFEFFAEAPPEAEPGFDDDNIGAEGHLDETTLPPELAEKRAHAGRWQLSSQTNRASGRQNVRYRGAPSWSGGRNCSGRLLPGTRELGQYLVNNFGGARSYQGYNCRQIRGSSGMSMHGTGRALDVFIPLDGRQADNDKGDPVAAYLIENAEHIGIQLIIWDRSIWSTSRSTRHRSYGGSHPHHDHLHIELTPEAANRQTAFFTGAMPDPGNGEEPPPAGNSGCNSATLGRQVAHGECVQMSYNRCGGTCNWAICDNGGWACQSDLSACGEQHGNNACAPPDQPDAPAGRACRSTTLGRSVPHGEAVQMAYDACGGTCRWAVCEDGGWDCRDANALGATQHPHAQCQRAPEPQGESCYSRTLGRSVPDGDRVQMSYAACSNRRRCQWAMCEDGNWNCTSDPARGTDHGHRSCR